MRMRAIVKFADDEGRALAAATPLGEQETLLTPTDAFYEVQHFGPPPVIDPSEYRLEIRGRMERPTAFTLEDLRSFPAHTVRTVIECSGNGQDDFPLMPHHDRVGDALFAGDQGTDGTSEGIPPRLLEPREYLASAGEFTGVPLATLLDALGLQRGVQSIRIEGADAGVPDPTLHGLPPEITNIAPFRYDKALPLLKALDPDTILAWAMNGELLSHVHGAPLRLVAPGWAGNWSVKWVTTIDVLDYMPDCWYQTSYYYYGESLNDPNREMITILPVKSIITDPDSRDVQFRSGSHTVRGFAWSGAGHISRVDVTFDGGDSWQEAHLEGSQDRWMWVRWSISREFISGEKLVVMSRAIDEVGRTQPLFPKWNVLRKNFNGMTPVVVSVQ